VAAISTFRLLLSLVLVNGVGFALRYFDYDTFIIIAGFRFHLSFFLPLLILFPSGAAGRAVNLLSHPEYKKKFLPLLWIILAPAIIMAALYFIDTIELADQDYFYEFGLSSVFDYPVYLVWNFPQFLLLFLFLDFSTQKRKNKFFPAFLLIFFLFIYEIIPVDFEFGESLFYTAGDFLITVICAAFLFSCYRNVYWFAISLFSALWFNLLAFGSGTTALINLLFAAQYDQWEGFFAVNKDYRIYLLAGQLLVMFILLLVFLPSRKLENSAAAIEISDIKTDLSV
jgi:hypothetical protein